MVMIEPTQHENRDPLGVVLGGFLIKLMLF